MDEINNEKTEKKVNKKVARSKKNAAKNVGKNKVMKEVKKTDTTSKTSLKNDGKCCRCVSYNKEHKCACKKSAKFNNYTARKNGCECFKYKN